MLVEGDLVRTEDVGVDCHLIQDRLPANDLAREVLGIPTLDQVEDAVLFLFAIEWIDEVLEVALSRMPEPLDESNKEVVSSSEGQASDKGNTLRHH